MATHEPVKVSNRNDVKKSISPTDVFNSELMELSMTDITSTQDTTDFSSTDWNMDSDTWPESNDTININEGYRLSVALEQEEERKNDENARKMNAYHWWSRMGHPNKKDMLRRCGKGEVDLAPSDVELLPWLSDGFFVDLPQIMKWMAEVEIITPKPTESKQRGSRSLSPKRDRSSHARSNHRRGNSSDRTKHDRSSHERSKHDRSSHERRKHDRSAHERSLHDRSSHHHSNRDRSKDDRSSSHDRSKHDRSRHNRSGSHDRSRHNRSGSHDRSKHERSGSHDRSKHERSSHDRSRHDRSEHQRSKHDRSNDDKRKKSSSTRSLSPKSTSDADNSPRAKSYPSASARSLSPIRESSIRSPKSSSHRANKSTTREHDRKSASTRQLSPKPNNKDVSSARSSKKLSPKPRRERIKTETQRLHNRLHSSLNDFSSPTSPKKSEQEALSQSMRLAEDKFFLNLEDDGLDDLRARSLRSSQIVSPRKKTTNVLNTANLALEALDTANLAVDVTCDALHSAVSKMKSTLSGENKYRESRQILLNSEQKGVISKLADMSESDDTEFSSSGFDNFLGDRFGSFVEE